MTSTREALESVAALLAGVIDKLPADPPEVPELVEVWPENDEHLRGDCWECSWGSIISYRDGGWHWWNRSDRVWRPDTTPGSHPPLKRIADPSQPRRFDSIADIPEDVERAKGKSSDIECSLARSPLSESGWMVAVHVSWGRPQWVELIKSRCDILSDIEEVIDHES